MKRRIDAENVRIDCGVTKGSWTFPLFLSVLAATIASFQFGYHIGCINVPAKVIIEWYVESHQYLFSEKTSYEEVARFQCY
ncbi:unnamed protein product [Dracunculus medinensis]|uniref:Transmembrane protein n=1 Tax=Dracunculus medinensis TaxID=318479 RepID=A0A0N4UK26_DRAME|nr:unnamed protein product [Dracunculus medinensis]